MRANRLRAVSGETVAFLSSAALLAVTYTYLWRVVLFSKVLEFPPWMLEVPGYLALPHALSCAFLAPVVLATRGYLRCVLRGLGAFACAMVPTMAVYAANIAGESPVLVNVAFQIMWVLVIFVTPAMVVLLVGKVLWGAVRRIATASPS